MSAACHSFPKFSVPRLPDSMTSNMSMLPRFSSVLLALALSGLALFWHPGALAQRAVPVDRVVAVVNNDVITSLELRDRMIQAVGQLQRQGVQLPPEHIIQRQVLEQMVLEKVQMQVADEVGIRVDEATMARAISRVASNNRLSETELRDALEADGISWERFRQQIRTEILLTRLREREVDSRVVVTEAEVDNFIASNPGAFSGREYLLAHILLRAPESPSQADIARLNARAEEVMQRIIAGEDFGRLAAAYSDAPDAMNSGLLGWRTQDRLPALFADALATLQPGQVSQVIRSAAGLHIVMFVDARGGELAAPEQIGQTRARHILLRTSEVLSDADAEARLLGLRERIVNGDDFAELARVHSVDLSGAKGGDLGWLNQGDTVPEFERAMDALAPGELSMPVRSPFGWHLIQVQERRVQDVTDELKRNVARNALRQRKAEEAYDDWLREQRDSAYVQLRLDRDADPVLD